MSHLMHLGTTSRRLLMEQPHVYSTILSALWREVLIIGVTCSCRRVDNNNWSMVTDEGESSDKHGGDAESSCLHWWCPYVFCVRYVFKSGGDGNAWIHSRVCVNKGTLKPDRPKQQSRFGPIIWRAKLLEIEGDRAQCTSRTSRRCKCCKGIPRQGTLSNSATRP